jgi:hypothetical protein
MYYIFDFFAIYKQTRVFNTTLTFRGNISCTPLREIYLNARKKDFSWYVTLFLKQAGFKNS